MSCERSASGLEGEGSRALPEPTLGEVQDLLDADSARVGIWIDAACREIVRLQSRRLRIDAKWAEDVAQEAATRILESLRSACRRRPLPRDTPLRAWVRGTVRNVVLELGRRAGRRRERLWCDMPPTTLERRIECLSAARRSSVGEGDAPPVVQPYRKADEEWARAAFSRLHAPVDPTTALLLALSAAGFRPPESANSLQLSLNAVRLRLRRLLRAFCDGLPPFAQRGL